MAMVSHVLTHFFSLILVFVFLSVITVKKIGTTFCSKRFKYLT